MNLGHFPAGERVRLSLDLSKAQGVPFNRAWNIAMKHAHLRRNGPPRSERQAEDAEAIVFARQAFKRAYEGQPPERVDVIAAALLHALELLYDDSDYAEPTPIESLMDAA